MDDEPIVISDLMTRIDWNLEGFEIKGYAYSAESALTLIKEYMPDLAFCRCGASRNERFRTVC